MARSGAANVTGPPLELRLVSAVTDLASARTLDGIVDIVRTTARSLTGADGATFVLRDGDRCFYVDEDAISPLWRGSRFPIDTCISGWAMLHRQAVVIEDVFADPRIPHEAYRPTFVKSLVMVPVRTADPVAAIGNYWAEPHLADDDEVTLLQALADSTAVALENVRVLEHLERSVAHRTAELEAANRDLKQFGDAVAHDLAAPLAAVRGFAELLAEQVDGDESLRALVAGIDRNTTRARELIDDLLTFSRAGTRPLKPEAIDVAAIVADTCERLSSLMAEQGAVVVVGDVAPVTADPSLLAQVVQNLMANAVSYGGRQVRVSAERDGDWWRLRVADDGEGVPESERDLIFQPFQRGSQQGRRPGSGLGLAICRRIAEQHGGRIELRTSPAGGAEFVVSLPA